MSAGRKKDITLYISIIWLLLTGSAMVFCIYMAATGHGAPLY